MLGPDSDFTTHVLEDVTLTFAVPGSDGITFEDVQRSAARFPGGLDYWASRAIHDAMGRLDPRFAVGPFDPVEILWPPACPTLERCIERLALTLMVPGNPDGASLDDVRAAAVKNGLSLDAFLSWCLAEATRADRAEG